MGWFGRETLARWVAERDIPELRDSTVCLELESRLHRINSPRRAAIATIFRSELSVRVPGKHEVASV